IDGKPQWETGMRVRVFCPPKHVKGIHMMDPMRDRTGTYGCSCMMISVIGFGHSHCSTTPLVNLGYYLTLPINQSTWLLLLLLLVLYMLLLPSLLISLWILLRLLLLC